MYILSLCLTAFPSFSVFFHTTVPAFPYHSLNIVPVTLSVFLACSSSFATSSLSLLFPVSSNGSPLLSRFLLHSRYTLSFCLYRHFLHDSWHCLLLVTPYGDHKKCTIRCIAWSHDDTLIATGGEDHTARCVAQWVTQRLAHESGRQGRGSKPAAQAIPFLPLLDHRFLESLDNVE